ncbi:VOC family protein [Streptomyces chartreusis]|uniref:VOC family protein n=1 Tax=Streptomyces chartreusis TaxID=1969 RepID=UPI0036B23D5C
MSDAPSPFDVGTAWAFDNIALSVTDMDRAVRWWSDVFGFVPGYRTWITPLGAEFQILERPDMRIELLSQPGSTRHTDAEVVPGPHLRTSGAKAVVFRTDDLDAATQHLERCEVEFVWKSRILSEDGLRSTMVREPDGVLVNVLCYPVGGVQKGDGLTQPRATVQAARI